MLKPLRVLQTGLGGGRWNTAVSAGLLRMRSAGTASDIIRFYGFTPSVLLGQTQDVAEAAVARRFPSEEVEVARRLTGGGAVYMCQSMLAWDFLTDLADGRQEMSVRIGTAIAAALRSLGWSAAAFAPPNDIAIDGRKVSGAATASRGRAFLHQGTLLLRDDAPAMARYLGIPVEAVRGRTTSLDAHATMAARHVIQAAIVEALACAFALAPVESALSPQEHALAEDEFAAEFGADAFVFSSVATESARA